MLQNNFICNKKDNKKGEIYINGYIYNESWVDTDTSPQWFIDETKKLKNVEFVDIFVNSGGGSILAAIAIQEMIKHLNAYVTSYITLAASAASWMINSSDKIVIPENAFFMIHLPSTVDYVNKITVKKIINDLEKFEESIILSFVNRNNIIKRENIENFMDGEDHWILGKEAVELGIADELEPMKKVENSINNKNLIVNGIEHKFKSLPNLLNIDNKQQNFDEIYKTRMNLIKSL